jgi:hypothetical protein
MNKILSYASQFLPTGKLLHFEGNRDQFGLTLDKLVLWVGDFNFLVAQ